MIARVTKARGRQLCRSPFDPSPLIHRQRLARGAIASRTSAASPRPSLNACTWRSPRPGPHSLSRDERSTAQRIARAGAQRRCARIVEQRSRSPLSYVRPSLTRRSSLLVNLRIGDLPLSPTSTRTAAPRPPTGVARCWLSPPGSLQTWPNTFMCLASMRARVAEIALSPSCGVRAFTIRRYACSRTPVLATVLPGCPQAPRSRLAFSVVRARP